MATDWKHGRPSARHTRYTEYLARQIRAYGLTPIVTIRNVLDTIVSFDDMMLVARGNSDPDLAWMADTPFALPLNYAELTPDARYRLLAHSLGVWQIQFHLSWTRCRRQTLVSPIVIRYETDIDLSGLRRNHVPVRAGSGRHEVIPADAREFLVDYARLFAAEVPEDEIRYLLD